MNKKQKKRLVRIILGIVTLAACFGVRSLFDLPTYALVLCFAVPYLIVGLDVLRRAFKGVVNLRPFDENLLMALSTLGAFLLGEYPEAVAVMLFYQIGELFQSAAVTRGRRSFARLAALRADTAEVRVTDGNYREMPASDVEVGSTVRVRVGEKIPLDGVVIDGVSQTDNSPLTGESMPCDASAGAVVFAGCVNLSGVLLVRTQKEYGESTASKILSLVENAAMRKANAEKYITRFAKVYTPVVCAGALLLALLPPLFRLLVRRPPMFSVWLYRALTFLVISCPCALVVSVPLAFFVALGGASEKGVLIKGACYLETLADLKTAVFDKTGTLTTGAFTVTAVDVLDAAVVGRCRRETDTDDADTCLRLASAAERMSSHPIAKSVCAAYDEKHENALPDAAEKVREDGGHGVEAVADGHTVIVGRKELLKKHHIDVPVMVDGGTCVYVACDGACVARIKLADTVKPNAAKAIAALRELGVTQTALLTGDTEAAAKSVADELKIDKLYAGLLPGDKLALLERLLSSGDGKTAFVGDGINDAPTLARADVGIAMGALGSDAACEAADVVIMDDDPAKLVTAVRLSRKCRRVAVENTVFSIAVKLICLLLTALGLTGMWMAVFADVGVMVLAVLNSLRSSSLKK